MNQEEFVTKYDSFIQDPLIREYFGKEKFFNTGYWLSDTLSPDEACFNLMEKLLEFIPQKTGTILDVACGLGATTSYLLKYYSPANIVGINISAKQLETCRSEIPGCSFILMDAVQMAFEDNLFDSILCVEAVYHFHTREKFLQEAWRVLKPGADLVLTDIIFESFETIKEFDRMMHPQNEVKSLEEYKGIYRRAGFEQIEIIDATNQCWCEFFRHLMDWAQKRFLAGELDEPTFRQCMVNWNRSLNSSTVRRYLLVSAKKPVSATTNQ